MTEDFSEQLHTILLAHPDGVSEYELIAELRQASVGLAIEADLQDSLSLFRLHFMLFHYLYRLRDRWLEEQKGSLQIDALKIILLPYSHRVSSELAESDELRRYYLDLDNLASTGVEELDQMLDRFWEKLLAAEDYHQALAELGLDATADMVLIKQRYRELAMLHHPDRGGEAKKLQSINDAMAVLKRYHGQ